jgi:hypothetical protein
MKLNELIYQKILFGERISSYKLYEEYWYVVKFNEQTNIHYTIKQVSNSRQFLWFLAAIYYSPKFKCETRSFKVWSSIEEEKTLIT